MHHSPVSRPDLVDPLDDMTRVIYLEVPSAQIVQFQAFFEIFEGVGIVRTLSVRKSLVCILTTADCLAECFRILAALAATIPWRQVVRPEEATKELYLGYFGRH
ncbi:MAG: DUF4911 domain-containing protein [Proteobacteria bacterium]|nr:DUF4911 domain-containing protein [Pseudomonadota bacterium]